MPQKSHSSAGHVDSNGEMAAVDWKQCHHSTLQVRYLHTLIMILFYWRCFSNGIGRSGVFCTLVSVLDCMKVESVIDVFYKVKLFRIKRPGIVQTVVSWTFLFLRENKFLYFF